MDDIRVEEVADGAWAAIAVPDAGAVGNAGFVQADGSTIVLDAHLTAQAGGELRAAAERVAPVALVVNSHRHGDRARGNGALPEVPIAPSKGHSASDVVHWLADERILDRIEELAPGRIVAGHGPVGTLDDVGTLRDSIDALPADHSLAADPGRLEAEIRERNASFVRSCA